MKLIIFSVLALFVIGSASGLNKAKDCKCRILPSTRIVGGRKANQTAYPWIGTLKVSPFIDDDPLCGVTILNENYVLTIGDLPFKEGDLIMNFLYIKFRGLKEGIEIEKVFNSSGDSKKNVPGIALIKLKEPLNFTNLIQPACLGVRQEIPYSGPLTIAGYGLTKPVNYFNNGTPEDSNLKFPNELMEGDVVDSTQSDEKCKGKNNQLICTKGKSALCLGDQGVGLHVSKAGKAYVVGVGSDIGERPIDKKRTRVCTEGNTFSRVSFYMDFIRKHVGDQYCD